MAEEEYLGMLVHQVHYFVEKKTKQIILCLLYLDSLL